MRDRDGLFEIEPVGKKQPHGRPAAVDKTFRAFDPHQVLLLPPALDLSPIPSTEAASHLPVTETRC